MYSGEEPLISIIVPNYNNGKYLRSCVESILAQTYKKIEIIVVDDSSTDNSREIIEELQSITTVVRPVYLEKNEGVSNARNKGVEFSAGEYITFLDADDFYVNSQKLENEIKLLLKKESEGSRVAVYSKLQAVDTEGKVLWNYKTKKQFSGKKLRRCILEESRIQLPRDYCMKKQWFLDAGGFEYGNSLYEDLEYLFRLAGNVNFMCTGNWGSAYRITNQGLSSVGLKEHKEALKKLRRRCVSDLFIFDRAVVCVMWIWNRIISLTKQLCKSVLFLLGLRKRRG